MTAILSSLFLFGIVIYLIYKNWVHATIVFPVFILIILLGIASSSNRFIGTLANLLGIKTGPLAIILVILFILFIMYLLLAIIITRIQKRQLFIMRELAQLKLEQEVKK